MYTQIGQTFQLDVRAIGFKGVREGGKENVGTILPHYIFLLLLLLLLLDLLSSIFYLFVRLVLPHTFGSTSIRRNL